MEQSWGFVPDLLGHAHGPKSEPPTGPDPDPRVVPTPFRRSRNGSEHLDTLHSFHRPYAYGDPKFKFLSLIFIGDLPALPERLRTFSFNTLACTLKGR
jgi:hypothetical protein